MTKVPSLNYPEVVAAFQRAGWSVVRQKGSHIRLERTSERETLKLTIPAHKPPSASATMSAIPRSDILDANGIRLHYLEWPAEKLALVSDFAARFSKDYRVVVMTRRGYGRSSVPREGSDLASRVEDIHALLDALGHSIAGDELTAFATKHPDHSARRTAAKSSPSRR